MECRHREKRDADNAGEKMALCVDLDGTLINTDMLLESSLCLLRKNPLYIFFMLFWSLHGRGYLKRKIAQRITFDPATLPYNAEVLEYVKKRRDKGAITVLATASDLGIAKAIAKEVGCFDEVIATDGGMNLTGKKKLKEIQARFDLFEYIGNEFRDIPIWQNAVAASVVCKNKSHLKRLSKKVKFTTVFMRNHTYLKEIIRALRPHQWVKNVLIFAPLFLAHVKDAGSWGVALCAFLSFSFCASAFYIVNDLIDITSDRVHPTKKFRPFASGSLSIAAGAAMAPLLLLLSALFALPAEPEFYWVLGGYAILTALYSLYLKKILMVDLIVLASFYTLRLFAGALAVNITISHWLLAFSMFLFFSLGCVKRYSELYNIREKNGDRASGRCYVVDDLHQISQLGSASGYISVLVMALYITSPQITQLYSRPFLLWLICPLMFYWIGRVWLLTNRGEMHDDPVVFALKDGVSYLVGALAAAIVLCAV
ncbi:MAG: UbiA family prenyltransferase [Candidatus Dadabacteria bacterium]|nr:MAG: UbiA family prenyltransferase [Candidatus Dadabacteria bacterium]